MHKKKTIVFTVLFLIILLPACAADFTERRTDAGFFFVKTVSFEQEESSPVNLLLFCDTRINGAKAIFIAIGGNIYIDGDIDGVVLTLFTKTVCTAKVKYGIINLRHAFFPFDLLMGIALLAVFRDFNEQSASYFERNKKSVLKFGFYGYIMALLLIGIFFVSVSGAVFAILGLAALLAAIIAGHVPASVVLGYSLLEGRVSRYNIYTLFVAGSVVIDTLKMFPLFGDLLLFIVMPVLSLGIFSVLLIHKRFYRAYSRVSFEKHARFDRSKMNSIITYSVDMEGRLPDERKEE